MNVSNTHLNILSLRKECAHEIEHLSLEALLIHHAFLLIEGPWQCLQSLRMHQLMIQVFLEALIVRFVQFLQSKRRCVFHFPFLSPGMGILEVLQLPKQLRTPRSEFATSPHQRRSIATREINVDAVAQVPAADLLSYKCLNACLRMQFGH